MAAPFALEAGGELVALDVAWCAYGDPAAPVVWVSHALTANADVESWWPGLFGPGRVLDPERYYIVCPNILGSCYGTTGPASLNPETGKAYGPDFRLVTVRDQARAQRALMDHLGIVEVELLIGGSLGGMQAMELALEAQPSGLIIHNLVLLACPPRHSAWGRAWNEAQRLALGTPATNEGLAAARAIAMLSYRTYGQYVTTQPDPPDLLQDYAAARYQRYQGQKLVARFDPETYRTLTLAMDSHDVARGRPSASEALARIEARTLVIGISSDLLFPVEEQRALAAAISGARLEVIESPYGHDGFLVEAEAIGHAVRGWL